MAVMNVKVARGFKTGTRINTIEVPTELRVKHTSGIDWVDTALGGEGFTPTVTMMLTGGPGTGKSTLLRMLANSLTAAGHLVLYNTGEESLFQAKLSCERLQLTQNFMVGEDTQLPKLLAFMNDLRDVAKAAGKQVFLLQDSLQTLNDGKYADGGTTSKTPVRCVEALVDWMQENFGICVFVGQVTKGDDFKGDNTIRHVIDVHAHMWYDTKEKSDTYGCLLFEVSKNRWGSCGATHILQLGVTGIVEQGHIERVRAN